MTRALLGVSLALLGLRVASAALVVTQPGFTDAYYYVDVARRLAHGEGLTADFVWNFIEAPNLAALPVASHRFWMPLTTVVQGAGIVALEPLVGTFRSAQAAIIVVAALLPAAAYTAARSIGARTAGALFAATLTGLGGGALAPAWVTLDSFAIAALVGTAFFIAFGVAATGDVRAGAAAGLMVGLLYLARAEGALFGVALLALAARPETRRAGLAGSAVALTIGLAWVGRSLALGSSPDLLARTVLLARYEDFFALAPTGALDLAAALGVRAAALGSNLLVAAGTVLFFLGLPLGYGIRAARIRPAVQAFAALALLLYLVESLVWPLHATRGSYFHSLAAFYPFTMAVVALGGEQFLATRVPRVRQVAALATVAASAVLAVAGLVAWDGAFNDAYRARVAALDAIPQGPFVAIDAAAWRYVANRTVLVTPADGLDAAECVAARYQAKSVVLEAAHFSAYASLYDGALPAWLSPPVSRGAVRVFPIRGELGCSVLTARS